jgi:hypothetical protein
VTQPDLALEELLARFVPERSERAEWDDVLRRAGVERRPTRRRALVLAVAAVALVGLALSPVGTAIADGVGGFAAWIRGEPGAPATPAEQQAFERSNERTWFKFAPGTKLRRLLAMEASGTTFTLYGFRSGDDLCLQLVARGNASTASTHCVPVHALQTADAPAVVVATDEGIGTTHERPNADGFVPAQYSASFGIASDGVARVLLRGDDGTHQALLGGNAFLFVDDHPKLGTRVRAAEAVAADGSRAALGLRSAPYGYFDLSPARQGRPPGPTRVERKVVGGAVGWVERREARGEPFPPALLKSWASNLSHRTNRAHVVLARVLRPDPDDYVRVGVIEIDATRLGSLLCTITIERQSMGGGCRQAPRYFPRRPFTIGGSDTGSGQYTLLSGLASDDVTRLTLFTVGAPPLEAQLRDNVWLARVARRDLPGRLVAFDRDGRVIGLQTVRDDLSSRAPRAAQRSVRTLARVAGENGQTATLRAGKAVGGYRCWSIEISNRGGGGGCSPWPVKGRPLLLVEGVATHGDVFLTGQLPPTVASVSLSFAAGKTLRVEPISGFLVYAVPHRFLHGKRLFVAARAYNTAGRQIGERGIGITR